MILIIHWYACQYQCIIHIKSHIMDNSITKSGPITDIYHDIINNIFAHLPLPDIRSFIQCNKSFNKISIAAYEVEFMKIISNSKILTGGIENLFNGEIFTDSLEILDQAEKYTLEFVFYGYANRIPERYICMDNRILFSYNKILYYCARQNYLEMCKILLKTNKYHASYFWIGAAAGGHLDLLKWINENNITRNDLAISKAAGSGNLDTVKWFYENNWEFDRDVVVSSAKHGHMHILNWIDQNQIFDDYDKNDQWMFAYAAKKYNPQILEWLLEKKYVLTSKACWYAARAGQLKSLQWLVKNGCKHTNGWICAYAALNGHFDIVKWAYHNGCKMTEKACFYAAQGGHFDILKWLRKKKCPWDKYTCDCAAEHNRFEILKWAYENGCEMDICTLYHAAKCGNLEMVKWIVEKIGCAEKNNCADTDNYEWTDRTYIFAAGSGNIEIFEWLDKFHGPIKTKSNIESTYHTAASKGHLNILKWLHEKQYQMTELIYIGAIKYGRIDILEWIFTVYPMPTELPKQFEEFPNIPVISKKLPVWTNMASCAANLGRIKILKWILQRKQFTVKDYVDICHRAVANSYSEIIDWFLETNSLDISHLVNSGLCSTAYTSGCNKFLLWMKESGCQCKYCHM